MSTAPRTPLTTSCVVGWSWSNTQVTVSPALIDSATLRDRKPQLSRWVVVPSEVVGAEVVGAGVMWAGKPVQMPPPHVAATEREPSAVEVTENMLGTPVISDQVAPEFADVQRP